MNWIEKKEELEMLIKSGEAYEAIARKYGCTCNAVKKAAKKLGIEIKRRREINSSEAFNKGKGEVIIKCEHCLIKFKRRTPKQIYCSKECSCKDRSKKAVDRWLSGEDKRDRITGANHMVRKYLMNINKNKCSQCGWGEVNQFTGKVPLEVHHVDGNCCNNSIENLRLLCPNCHTLTSNYGSRGGSKNSRERTKYYKKG